MPGSVRAASHVAAVASWVATNMSAAWCLTAWNIPMTRPNCSRTLAYSLAMVTHVVRTARRLGGGEEATEHDRGVATRRRGRGRRPVARSRVTVPTRRVASVFAGHRDGDLVAGGDHEVVAAGEEEQVGEPGAEHEVLVSSSPTAAGTEPSARPGR